MHRARYKSGILFTMMMKPSCPGLVKDVKSENTLKMRAAYYQQNGHEDVIQITDSMARPNVGSGELLVKVLGSAVNPVDIKVRENSMPAIVRPFPKIPGSDMCGIVVDTSQSVHHHFSIGDTVMTMVPYIFTGWGSACEFVAVKEDFLAKAPTNISDLEAASLPLTSLTVMQGFQSFLAYHKSHTADKKVLIQAGAGGLGVFAIQYCKNELGMTVYTTCSTQNVDFVKSLGADVVIDYTKDKFEDMAVGMDVVFDPMTYMYETRTFASDVLKPRGSFYINVPSSQHTLNAAARDPLGISIPEAAPHKILLGYGTAFLRSALFHMGFPLAHYDFKYVHPDGAMLAQVAALVEAGKVRAVVLPENVFPLEQTAAAHRRVSEGHVRGKVVISVASR